MSDSINIDPEEGTQIVDGYRVTVEEIYDDHINGYDAAKLFDGQCEVYLDRDADVWIQSPEDPNNRVLIHQPSPELFEEIAQQLREVQTTVRG